VRAPCGVEAGAIARRAARGGGVLAGSRDRTSPLRSVGKHVQGVLDIIPLLKSLATAPKHVLTRCHRFHLHAGGPLLYRCSFASLSPPLSTSRPHSSHSSLGRAALPDRQLNPTSARSAFPAHEPPISTPRPLLRALHPHLTTTRGPYSSPPRARRRATFSLRQNAPCVPHLASPSPENTTRTRTTTDRPACQPSECHS
jgi:hypothetical protein